jgi:CBS domain-containing protein
MDISLLMTEDVVSAKSDDNIIDVAKIMREKRIHAIPVLDDKRKVLGIITETDFFNKESSTLTHLPTFLDFVKAGKLKEETLKEGEEKGLIKAMAKDIMSSPCRVLPQDAKPEEFIQIVRATGFVSVPIVNNLEDNQLIGILTVADLMKVM